jgi:hypothetical protein
MIISVEEFKKHIETTLDDSVLEAKLQALELLIRNHTNNNFQNRGIRFQCPIMTTKLYLTTPLLKVGDTVQISQSIYSDGIYVIKAVEEGFIVLDKALIDESDVLVTKVEYPMDVVFGAVNLMKWELENRDKVGIQSETISRHSVTYFNMDGDNSSMGYPKSLLGFLMPYKKARF